eukprot:jgi/Bigna1/78839/fgenesh1_pg.57_\
MSGEEAILNEFKITSTGDFVDTINDRGSNNISAEKMQRLIALLPKYNKCFLSKFKQSNKLEDKFQVIMEYTILSELQPISSNQVDSADKDILEFLRTYFVTWATLLKDEEIDHWSRTLLYAGLNKMLSKLDVRVFGIDVTPLQNLCERNPNSTPMYWMLGDSKEQGRRKNLFSSFRQKLKIVKSSKHYPLEHQARMIEQILAFLEANPSKWEKLMASTTNLYKIAKGGYNILSGGAGFVEIFFGDIDKIESGISSVKDGWKGVPKFKHKKWHRKVLEMEGLASECLNGNKSFQDYTDRIKDFQKKDGFVALCYECTYHIIHLLESKDGDAQFKKSCSDWTRERFKDATWHTKAPGAFWAILDLHNALKSKQAAQNQLPDPLTLAAVNTTEKQASAFKLQYGQWKKLEELKKGHYGEKNNDVGAILLNLLKEPLLRKKLAEDEKMNEKIKNELQQNYINPKRDLKEHLEPYLEYTRQFIDIEFKNWLLKKESKSRVMWICAGPGMGKTVSMAHLAEKFKDNILAVHFCSHTRENSRQAEKILLSLAHQLTERLPWYKEKVYEELTKNGGTEGGDANGNWDRFFRYPFRNKFSETPNQKIVLLIDALDEAKLEDANSSILRILRRRLQDLPSWVGVAVSSRPEVKVKEELDLYEPLKIECENKDNIADVRRYVEHELKERNIADQGLHEYTNIILEKAKGMFLYANLVFKNNEDVFENIKDKNLLKVLKSLPVKLEAYYHSCFERAISEDEFQKDLLKDILEVTVAAQRELKLWEITEILLHSRDRDYEASFEKLFEPMFNRVYNRLNHKSVKDYLVDNKAYKSGKLYPYRINERKGHHLFAEHLWDNVLRTFLGQLPLKSIDNVKPFDEQLKLPKRWTNGEHPASSRGQALPNLKYAVQHCGSHATRGKCWRVIEGYFTSLYLCEIRVRLCPNTVSEFVHACNVAIVEAQKESRRQELAESIRVGPSCPSYLLFKTILVGFIRVLLQCLTNQVRSKLQRKQKRTGCQTFRTNINGRAATNLAVSIPPR